VLKIQESDLDDERYQGGGVKQKYCVVLNARLPDDPIFYAHSTTRLRTYESGEWDVDILRIPAGSYSFFSEETVLNLRSIKNKRVAELRTLMDRRQLFVCGDLSEAHMRELNTKIRCSSLLSPAQISKVALPE
jgi:hypothetical protein